MQRTGQKTLQIYSKSTDELLVKRYFDKFPIFYVIIISFASYIVQCHSDNIHHCTVNKY